ncbi:MAG: hypothetical protein EZS28_031116 [Streblomastix strix]|uniref:Uncharacterized protein n=1 Tax=Streblomastix strix TaxID=222440 RepID=A0A5J4USH0_9EUKA|nr:MAG: hypothetical protein EZS28_031116 [Streblomastix strix]
MRLITTAGYLERFIDHLNQFANLDSQSFNFVLSATILTSFDFTIHNSRSVKPSIRHQTGQSSSSSFQQTLHQRGDICSIDFSKRSIINSVDIPIILKTKPLVRYTHLEENIPVRGTLTRSQFEMLSKMMFFIEVISVNRTHTFYIALMNYREELLNYALFLSALLLQGENELPLVPPYDLIQSKEDTFVVSGLITSHSPVQQHSISGSQLFRNNSEAIGDKIVFTVNQPDQYSQTPSMFAVPIPSPDQPASPISVEAPSYTYQYRISMNLAFVLSIFYKCTVIHYDVAEYLSSLPYLPSLLITLMCQPVNVPTSQLFSIKLPFRNITLRGAALRLACTVARINSQLAEFLEKLSE